MSSPLSVTEGSRYDPETVTGLLRRAVSVAGDAPAVHYEGEAIGFRTLAEASRRAAAGLAALGVGVGDRVAFWLPNTPAYLTLYFACARLGATAVAVNTRYRAVEVEELLARTAPRVLVMWPGFRGIDFPGRLAGVDLDVLGRVGCAVLLGDGDGRIPVPGIRRTIRFEWLLDHDPLERDASRPELALNTFTTSGTTSAPKLVVHAQRSIAVHAAEVARSFGYTDAEGAILQDLPLTGVFGLASTLAALAAGRAVVLASDFDAERSVDALRRHRIVHLDASDEMIHRLLEAGARESDFRHVGFAGYAAFNSQLGDIVERAEARGLRLVGLWGMSEMQALVARRDPSEPPTVRKRGGGRLVSPGAAARVRDPDTGSLCGEGVAGELELRGPSMMTGYLDDPEATAAVRTDDGFLRTGDLALMESQACFQFLSRMGDVLRLGGYLVNPAEIETEILALPAVSAVQVVSAPAEGGERAVAFVVPKPGGTEIEGAVRAHCGGRMASYKVPAAVISVSEFPVTDSPNGVKVQRARLREMARYVLCGPDGA